MSADPNRPNLKSTWQDHDLWYVIDRLREEFPHQPSRVIHDTVGLCKAEVQHTEGREKLLEAARNKMRALPQPPDPNCSL